MGRRKGMMLVGPPACRAEQRATLKPTPLGPPLQSKCRGQVLHAHCPCGKPGRTSALRFLLSRAACAGAGVKVSVGGKWRTDGQRKSGAEDLCGSRGQQEQEGEGKRVG